MAQKLSPIATATDEHFVGPADVARYRHDLDTLKLHGPSTQMLTSVLKNVRSQFGQAFLACEYAGCKPSPLYDESGTLQGFEILPPAQDKLPKGSRVMTIHLSEIPLEKTDRTAKGERNDDRGEQVKMVQAKLNELTASCKVCIANLEEGMRKANAIGFWQMVRHPSLLLLKARSSNMPGLKEHIEDALRFFTESLNVQLAELYKPILTGGDRHSSKTRMKAVEEFLQGLDERMQRIEEDMPV